MPEPLVCEDSDLAKLLEQVYSQPGARILYQDTVRRGGVLGFFAREVHRVAYEIVAPAAAELTGAQSDGLLDPQSDGLGDPPSDSLSAPAVSPTLAALLRTFDEAAGDRPGPSSKLVIAGQDRSAPEVEPATDGLADLLASTDAAESAANADGPAPDFAELLRRITLAGADDADASTPNPSNADFGKPDSGKPAARTPNVSKPNPSTTEASAADLPAAIPEPADTGRAVVTAIGRTDARGRLELLMQLRQIGVPVSLNPRSDTHSLYQALEDILAELPAPVEPPRQPGAVIAIVGESTPALRAAYTVAGKLRIPRRQIGIAGLSDESPVLADHCLISGPAEAARLRDELSNADTPAIVVIATDAVTADPADPWASQMLAALAPAAVWAVVDARWKTEDSRIHIDRLGPVDALVVHAAELSLSPASVWDLDLPLALLDGRSPTTFAWTGLLFRLLATDARHRATA
ncbi:MAG TPA: hypothetical protein VFD94_12470 [Jatrophihabitans sp.]|nr:hypothetical protein [Jatrophihabitans sp.]